MMATESSLQDCYFYFYSSCTKGDECPFRHCELALGTETVCSLWREGRCFRSNCKFRHMESRINRTMIPCYWENQPGGCRKPHCVFLHRKLRNGTQVIKDTPGLILPTSDGTTSPNLPDLNDTTNISNKATPVDKAVESDAVPDSSLSPVPPLVLSFDEGEESDTESVTSTPVKQSDKKAALTKNNLIAGRLVEEKDFGIKTLEQIRMEKIHKESDSYYGAAYTSTPLDATLLIDQHYPPKTEFLALPKDPKLDKSLPAPIIEPKLSGVDDETDLRGRLSSRRSTSSNKVNQVKRIISFNKQTTSEIEGVSKRLDFKIKTLEEIRREKENKQSKSEVASNSSLVVLPSLEEKNINIPTEKTSKKLKINRKSRELYSAPAVLNQDPSTPNLADSSLLISSGIKKKPSSPEKLAEVLILCKNSSNSPGKRKTEDSSNMASKLIKLNPISNRNYKPVNGINACSKESGEKHLQSLQDPGTEIFAASVANNMSASSNLKQDEIIVSQSSIIDVEMDSLITTASMSSSKSSHTSHLLDGTVSVEDKHSYEDNIKNNTQISLPLPATIDSIPSNDNNSKKGKDSLIDRSMSVDDDLDEFLEDNDMNIDEIDSAPNDDILLQIEEFLES